MNAWVASLTFILTNVLTIRKNDRAIIQDAKVIQQCCAKEFPAKVLADWKLGSTLLATGWKIFFAPASSGLKISLFESNEKSTPLLSTWALCIAQGKTTFCDILGQGVVRKYEFRLAHPVTPATASDTWASQLHPSGPTSRVGHSDYAVSIRQALRRICA